ncbi:amidohydrolase family protein [Methyloversatilis discipulorum]|uniref:amidohydrolase family protein n=1 Tax=Methyloversatilis discipulorum TaxID=1119528 RepID=UPI000368B9F9|nr:amidohydrolase family protein [Methyloversatilis discipulorum]
MNSTALPDVEGGLFDAHLHIIAPGFPLIPNQGYTPDYFTVDDYLARARPLGITGGAVVSGSFQGFDQTYLLDALARLGPGFVGVTQLPADTPDDVILDLDSKGVRAIRFNLQRGGSEDVSQLEHMALRVHELCGWHVELYVANRHLAGLRALLARLPKVSIDHLGLTAEGFDDLLWLVERGIKVKATGFGRCDFDVAEALRRIDAVNPEALMFGTDLPCTRAPRVFRAEDINLLVARIDGYEGRALRDNAMTFFRTSSD